jgi:hypothetical protein
MLPTESIEKEALLRKVKDLEDFLKRERDINESQTKHVEAQSRLIQTQTQELQELRTSNKDLRAIYLEQTKIIEQQRITISHDLAIIKSPQYDLDRFQQSRAMVYKLCLEQMSNGKGLTNAEIVTFFTKKYPAVSAANVQRRVYELEKPQFGSLLFKHPDSDGKTRWFLNLHPRPEDIGHLDDSFSGDVSP